tara:strand:+ start:794 stop:1189 length:396 start_codon:yes stop_codon:yes gene_type:complete
MNKTDKLINISELSKLLNLLNRKDNKPSNHVIRYWEKEFKQIKPKIINKRRYYSVKQVELLKMIKFLLKNKGMTMSGVKNVLNSNINKLDDYNSHGLKAEYYLNNFKKKSRQILDKIKKIKNYGKKNSLKS